MSMKMIKAPRAMSSMLAAALVLSGCTMPEGLEKVQMAEGQQSIIVGTRASSNVTPISKALECYGDSLVRAASSAPSIAIGDIRDYTGKQMDSEGFAVTQGGALMAYTALGRMVPGVVLHERFDTRVADAELAYIAKRQLGDGAQHTTEDPATGQTSQVPWKPYFGGSVLQSDYFVVGGITELNYNISSGGAELSISNVGGKSRRYTMNVAVDLRIVGTQSLKVYDTVSLQKQITGREIGVGVFRFFGSDLYDLNAGLKEQEPLQLAVRMVIEQGILELVESIADVEAEPCLAAAMADHMSKPGPNRS